MNRLSKVIGMVAAALVLAAVALPAAAGNNKVYTLNMSPASLAAGSSGAQVTAAFTNTSPLGNSTIVSLKLFAPSGITIRTAQVQNSTDYSALAVVQSDGKSVWVDSINQPIKPGGPAFVLSMTVDAASTGACGGGWTTLEGQKEQVYTGSGWSGQTFSRVDPSNVNTSCSYHVTYSGNGSTGGSVPVDSNTYAPGATVTVLGNTGGLTKTDYRFAGWNTAADGSGASYTGGATFTMGSQAVQLYAMWTRVYRVTYDGTGSTGGSVPVDSGAYATGETVTVSGAGSLTRTGYTFDRWNTAANGSGTPYAGGATFAMGPANVTLYAQWKQNTMTLDVPASATLNNSFTVTVHFDPAGGAAVTLSSTDCTLSSGTGTPAPDGSSVAFQVTITAAASFQCTIKAVAAGGSYAEATATISPVNTGILGCGDPVGSNKAGNLEINTDPPLAYIGDPDWGLVRAQNNKDNNPCTIAVPFQFEFDAVSNKAAFIIPDTFGQKVAVEYVLLWSPIPTDSVPVAYPGLPFALAELAWLKDGSGAWVYVPALACVEDDVELGEAATGPQPVLPMIPDIEPFQSLAAQYPGYAPGAVAKMCVAQEGWTSVGRDLSGSKLRQYWHKVIDYADGGIQLSR